MAKLQDIPGFAEFETEGKAGGKIDSWNRCGHSRDRKMPEIQAKHGWNAT